LPVTFSRRQCICMQCGEQIMPHTIA
jgi:ribosomal protein L32